MGTEPMERMEQEYEAGPPEETHVREHLRVIRKHMRLVLACLLVVVGIVGVMNYLETPVFRATAKVLIEREPPRVVNIQDVTPVDYDPWDSTQFFQTQIQLARSRPLVQRLIDSLALRDRKPALAGAQDPAAALLGAVSVEHVKNTRFIEIRVDDPDPKLAAEIANGLATGFLSQNLELKLAASRDALAWLTTHVTDLKSKVNESELALQRYKEQAGLGSSEEKQSLAAKKLAEFHSAYIEAKARRLEMETRLNELRKAARQPEVLESSPVVVNNPLFQRLKGQAVELEVQRSKLLKVYKDKHPEVLKVQSQIDEINLKIRDEVARLIMSLESEYNVLKAREAAMVAAVNEYRGEAQSVAKKEIESGILKREADTNQQLYEILLKRLKEISLSQGLDTNNVRVVDPAVSPSRPVRPRVLFNMTLALSGGLLLGLALAFFVEYMDDTVRTAEHLEKALGVPVFGVIPVIPVHTES